jgi:hypothetical protein
MIVVDCEIVELSDVYIKKYFFYHKPFRSELKKAISSAASDSISYSIIIHYSAVGK